MATGGVFPAPMKILGVAIIVIATLALVNNVDFLSKLTTRRVA